MKKKAYIKPELDIVLVATQSMIAASLPSSVPGGFPGLGGGGGIKAESFDEDELIDFDKEINGLLW